MSDTFPEGECARIVAKARTKYWTEDSLIDEEFVAGALAVLDIEGRILPPGMTLTSVRAEGVREGWRQAEAKYAAVIDAAKAWALWVRPSAKTMGEPPAALMIALDALASLTLNTEETPNAN